MIRLNFKKLDQAGLTLIELLVCMALLSGLLIVMADIFDSSADLQTQTTSYSSVSSNAELIMARLNYDIRRASAVTTPSTLGSSTSTLDITVSGNSYSYGLSSGNLQLTDNAGTDNLNDNDATISGLSFQELGNSGGLPTILYSFTVTSNAQQRGTHDSQTFTGAAGLR